MRKVFELTWERPSLLVGRWYCPWLCCRSESPLGCGRATLQAQEATSSETAEVSICKKRQSVLGQTSSSVWRRKNKKPTARQRDAHTLPGRLFSSLVLIQIVCPGSRGAPGRTDTAPSASALDTTHPLFTVQRQDKKKTTTEAFLRVCATADGLSLFLQQVRVSRERARSRIHACLSAHVRKERADN